MSDDLSDDAEKWGRLLAFAQQGAGDWLPEELGDIWRHQLAAPMDVELGSTLEEWVKSNPGKSVPPTIGDLLADVSPPLGLLILVKNVAVARRSDEDFPSEIATALYFAAVAVALARHGERITELDDGALRRGFTWAMRTDWLDPCTRGVMESEMPALIRK